MKKEFVNWQFIGFITTILLGTLLHFLYDWSNEFILLAPFTGVNESTWEHMKLLFWPMFIFAIIQSFLFKDRKDFWCIKVKCILLGIILIPVIFYTYNGAISKSPDWINITIFFVSAAIVYIYETRQFNKSTVISCNYKKSILTICIIALLFIIFTFIPPEIGLFKDPISGLYGI